MGLGEFDMNSGRIYTSVDRHSVSRAGKLVGAFCLMMGMAGCAEINLLSHAIKETLPENSEPFTGEGGE